MIETLDIPHAHISQLNMFMKDIQSEWRREIPQRINTHETDQGHGLGGPAFAPEFVSYVGFLECSKPGCGICAKERKKLHAPSNPESRIRATKALRKLRRVAPREFDAVYSVYMLGQSVEEVAERLTARGREVYGTAEVLVLLMSGVDKVIHFWRSA